MKILQFNIQYGLGWNPENPDEGDLLMDPMLEVIREQDPDIVFLQEVERALPDGKQAEPPPNFKIMKAALEGFHSFFSYPPANPMELPFGIGLAIFSRYPLENPFTVTLPAPDFTFEFLGEKRKPTERLLIGADVVVEDKPIRLLNIHLQAFFIVNQTGDDFPEQRNVVGEQVQLSPYPVILAGDFNSVPDEGTIPYFEGLGLTSGQIQAVTWHRKPFVLDHIFFSKEFSCDECGVIPSHASDHLPVTAVIDWK